MSRSPYFDEQTCQKILKPDPSENKLSFAHCDKWEPNPAAAPGGQKVRGMAAVWKESLGKWQYVARIILNGKSRQLGTYDTAEVAAKVASAARWRRDKVVREMRTVEGKPVKLPVLGVWACLRVTKPSPEWLARSEACCEKWKLSSGAEPWEEKIQGVSVVKSASGWTYNVHIYLTPKTWHIGTFNTAEEAALASSAALWRRDWEVERWDEPDVELDSDTGRPVQASIKVTIINAPAKKERIPPPPVREEDLAEVRVLNDEEYLEAVRITEGDS